MRWESALQLVLEHPPHPYPFIDPDSPNSVYSLFYSPVPAILLPLTPQTTLTPWRDFSLPFPVRGLENTKGFVLIQKA
jgi:hypothetical protein